MSQEDKKFLQILDEGTRLKGGHYEILLSFRYEDVALLNSRVQAEKRFGYLQKKMSRNEKFREDYMKFMKDLLSKGYGKESTTFSKEGKGWYLPHHGLYKASRPGKVCVVFDLSAEFNRTLVNKALLLGPDLTNQIVGVLLQFREEQIAVTGDTEAMFYQVKIPEDHKNSCGSFGGKIATQPKRLDHEMTAHVFGDIFTIMFKLCSQQNSSEQC